MMYQKEIMQTILNSGYECYYIGGMVRNKLMDLPITDVDLVTSATPEELLILFKDNKSATCGNTFLVTMIDGIEVSTYRKDRNDFAIVASSLKEDVIRRDFTINGIAMDINGNIIDLVNGRNDIENKVLRTIGNPMNRFIEDPVRIIRGLRFASIYDLTIEEETSKAMHKCIPLLNKVPRERFIKEIEKVFNTTKAGKFLDYLMEYDLFYKYFPSLAGLIIDGGKHHPEIVIDHSILAVKALDEISCKKWELKLAALYHDVGKQEYQVTDDGLTFYNHNVIGVNYIDKDLRRLKCNSKVISYCKNLCIRHMDSIWSGSVYDKDKTLSKKAIRKLIIRLKNDNIDLFDWLLLKYADRKANIRKTKYTTLDYYEKLYDDMIFMLKDDNTFKVSDLEISGNDVMELFNIKPGPEIGKYLKMLFNAVIDDIISNKKEELIKYLKENR